LTCVKKTRGRKIGLTKVESTRTRGGGNKKYLSTELLQLTIYAILLSNGSTRCQGYPAAILDSNVLSSLSLLQNFVDIQFIWKKSAGKVE